MLNSIYYERIVLGRPMAHFTRVRQTLLNCSSLESKKNTYSYRVFLPVEWKVRPVLRSSLSLHFVGKYPAPTKLMTDFERAIFQGYQQVYGAGVAHQYCVFHFHQNILRNIKKRGLSSLVQTPFGKGHLQSMMALALVEPQEVPDYFDAVVLSAHNTPPPLGTNFRL
ncbi:unnamed protein product, partial [Mesorhabditis belari]|uniref:MULE transposase domain-containing protein n=1 Tax=Mesorhabditis belari TaxID=2138241 RepID=A0AAF3E7Y3_9BILA